MPRIVSLLPSATEILALLGADRALVGRSHECDWPPTIKHLPVLTAARVQQGTSAEIDTSVRELLARSQSLYTIDEPAIAALRPDLILTQDLCNVCSIDLPAVRRLAERLDPAPEIVSLNPTTVDGMIDDVLTVGRAVGLDQRASHEAVKLRERFAAAAEFVNPYEEGPNVAFLAWTEPLFIGGHWTVQLIERAGGRHPLNPTVPNENAGAAVGPQNAQRRAGKSIAVPAEILVASRPDIVIVCPCGLDLAATRSAMNDLESKSWWRELPAVKNGRVALVDGNQMFNRPGPRLADAFEWMVGWLQKRPELMPEEFPWEEWPS